jgi:hypothetical protein
MKKLNLSLLIFIASTIAIIVAVFSYFFIGINIIGLWDISKFYIPIAFALILVDKTFNIEVNKKYLFLSIIFTTIFVTLLVLELYMFWY